MAEADLKADSNQLWWKRLDNTNDVIYGRGGYAVQRGFLQVNPANVQEASSREEQGKFPIGASNEGLPYEGIIRWWILP